MPLWNVYFRLPVHNGYVTSSRLKEKYDDTEVAKNVRQKGGLYSLTSGYYDPDTDSHPRPLPLPIHFVDSMYLSLQRG